MAGPVPKRADSRTRRNKPENEGGVALTKGTMRDVTKVPAARTEWDPKVKAWYQSIAKSGQSDFFQLSDYEQARILGDVLNDYYIRPSAMLMQAFLSGCTSLGMMEGDRRRMRIELEQVKETTKPASVTAIEEYKKKLGV